MSNLIQELNARNKIRREEEIRKAKEKLQEDWSKKMANMCAHGGKCVDFADTWETMFKLYMNESTNVMIRINEKFPFLYGC